MDYCIIAGWKRPIDSNYNVGIGVCYTQSRPPSTPYMAFHHSFLSALYLPLRLTLTAHEIALCLVNEYESRCVLLVNLVLGNIAYIAALAWVPEVWLIQGIVWLELSYTHSLHVHDKYASSVLTKILFYVPLTIKQLHVAYFVCFMWKSKSTVSWLVDSVKEKATWHISMPLIMHWNILKRCKCKRGQVFIYDSLIIFIYGRILWY